MPCGWEGDRRSVVALAMCLRLQSFFQLWVQGLWKRDEHPAYTPHTSPLLLHSPDLIPGKPPIELSFFIWYLHPVSNIWLCVLTQVCPPNGMSIGLTSIAQLVSLFLCSAHSALRCFALYHLRASTATQKLNLSVFTISSAELILCCCVVVALNQFYSSS